MRNLQIYRREARLVEEATAHRHAVEAEERRAQEVEETERAARRRTFLNLPPNCTSQEQVEAEREWAFKNEEEARQEHKKEQVQASKQPTHHRSIEATISVTLKDLNDEEEARKGRMREQVAAGIRMAAGD